jgi:isoleucyl-tRNA synthetase
VFDRDGSDAMRWFLMSSSVLRGGNLVVTEEAIREGVRQVLLPLWSTWYFFSLYANASGAGDASDDASGYTASWRTDSTDVLDRYLLAKTRDLIEDVTTDLDALDSTLAAAKVRDFADVLTNWYVRRSRERFWAGVQADGTNSEAFDTLFTVLETLTRVAAPLLPLVSERIWQGLTGGRSVHLTDWPDADLFPADPALMSAMDQIRSISSTALSLRKQSGLRVRLPLATLTIVATNTEALRPFESILRDELNVKSVDLVELAASSADDYGITSRLTVNARAAGPRLGKDVQRVIRAARAGMWSEVGGVVSVDGIELVEGEYELALEAASAADSDAADSGAGSDSGAGAAASDEERPSRALALLPGGGFVLLDTGTTPELEAEGLARDVIRAAQDTRRTAGFDVSDRIRLDLVFFSDEDASAVASVTDVDIAAETLATESHSYRAADNPSLAGYGDQLPSEWLSSVLLHDADFYQDFQAAQFANAGRFIVAVTRLDGRRDV